MFRYHRVLYRRLLRGQSTCELLRLRDESGSFPTLAQLIEDELERRAAEVRVRRPDRTLTVLPFIARSSAMRLS